MKDASANWQHKEACVIWATVILPLCHEVVSVLHQGILMKSGLLNARSLRHRVQSPELLRPIRRRRMKTLESGSIKNDCKIVRISLHRHYILNMHHKRDKRNWPITHQERFCPNFCSP
jgi:hypothetical protein